jgi:large subunit ribosomal protein L35
MPKLKKHRGTTKRVTITKNNKVIRLRAGDKHFNQKKSSGRKRATAVKAVVTGEISKNLKRAIGA